MTKSSTENKRCQYASSTHSFFQSCSKVVFQIMLMFSTYQMHKWTCNEPQPPPHAVATATATIITTRKLRNCGSTPGRSKTYFSSPQYPNWLWGPPSLLLNQCMKLISHLDLVMELRTVDIYFTPYMPSVHVLRQLLPFTFTCWWLYNQVPSHLNYLKSKAENTTRKQNLAETM